MIFNLSNASGSSGTYVYICNGVDDNVKISEIVKEYLNSGTDYDSMRLLIEGKIGVNSYINGTGSFNAPFEWFDFNIQSNKRIILDFFNCSQLTIPIISGKYHSKESIEVHLWMTNTKKRFITFSNRQMNYAPKYQN